ncbi:MAG: quaternary ammonium compound efflux SMR transporter SugE [Bacteroidetes bacterium]|nr:quaternary ammonium compound efflux SMR transporter SugE [Bacteroidota bacterium]
MAWVYLFIASVCEIGWAIGLKYSEGFTKLVPSIFTTIGMIATYYFLALALKTIPVGTGYAIWTGIGAVGTAILGMILFNESKDLFRIISIGLIVAGIIGLKFFSSETMQ